MNSCDDLHLNSIPNRCSVIPPASSKCNQITKNVKMEKELTYPQSLGVTLNIEIPDQRSAHRTDLERGHLESFGRDRNKTVAVERTLAFLDFCWF